MLSRDSVATLRPTTRLLLAGCLIPPQGAAVPPAAGPGLPARWSPPAPARAAAELGDGERNYRERGWREREEFGTTMNSLGVKIRSRCPSAACFPSESGCRGALPLAWPRWLGLAFLAAVLAKGGRRLLGVAKKEEGHRDRDGMLI